MGKDFQAPLKYKQWMLEAGFVDVVAEQRLVPLNGWPLDPKDQLLGKWHSADMMKFVPATTKITQASGMPLEEIPAFQERVLECVTRFSMRVYNPCKSLESRPAGLDLVVGKLLTTAAYIIYGRRPVAVK